MIIILFVLGLLFGSFATALSYRLVHGESIAKGRSHCDNCHAQIHWYDNIPLLSFLLLGGKCRSCKKPISIRYPLIELSTALSFVAAFLFQSRIVVSYLSLPVILFFIFIFIVIFVIDWEHQIIPDELVFIGLGVLFTVFILSDFDKVFLHLFAGFAASLFLLLINFLTRGRGMGLGDVKLAILMGVVLGIYSINWMFLSFIIGGLVGLVLLALGKAKMADRIAFGPFLIIGFFVTIFGGIIFDICNLLVC
jgi:leader peptidase (prepilin peptidase) / N-methyltransferase